MTIDFWLYSTNCKLHCVFKLDVSHAISSSLVLPFMVFWHWLFVYVSPISLFSYFLWIETFLPRGRTIKTQEGINVIWWIRKTHKSQEALENYKILEALPQYFTVITIAGKGNSAKLHATCTWSSPNTVFICHRTGWIALLVLYLTLNHSCFCETTAATANLTHSPVSGLANRTGSLSWTWVQ